jgi:hypothetical protein
MPHAAVLFMVHERNQPLPGVHAKRLTCSAKRLHCLYTAYTAYSYTAYAYTALSAVQCSAVQCKDHRGRANRPGVHANSKEAYVQSRQLHPRQLPIQVAAEPSAEELILQQQGWQQRWQQQQR